METKRLWLQTANSRGTFTRRTYSAPFPPVGHRFVGSGAVPLGNKSGITALPGTRSDSCSPNNVHSDAWEQYLRVIAYIYVTKWDFSCIRVTCTTIRRVADTQNMTTKAVSVIGLGDMGSAIARLYLKQGWKTTVWNRTESKAISLAEQGAIAASSVKECAAASPVVVSCLLTPDSVLEVLHQMDSETCSGLFLVDYTSGSKNGILQCANAAKNLGMACYIRGSIATTPRYLGNRDTRLFYSGGSQDIFKTIEPMLEPLGQSIYLGDDVSSTVSVEAALASSFFCFASGIVQSIAMAKKCGLWGDKGAQMLVSEVIQPLCRTVYPAFAAEIAQQIDSGSCIGGGDGLRLDTVQSALSSLTKTTASNGVSPTLLLSMKQLVDDSVVAGHATEELSSLVQFISNAAHDQHREHVAGDI